MSVVIVNGTPGKGKTLNLTREALKKYKRDNSKINRKIRKLKGEQEYVNLIYSDYPILLDKKRKIYSHKCSIYDLNIDNLFPVGSSFYMMEIQLCYDSTEYDVFPDIIAAFLQAHRHAGIEDIFFDSQSMSRIIKKMRIIACERWQILWTFCLSNFIPFLPLGITKYKICYDTEEEKTSDLDSETHISFFNTFKVAHSYDTKCLSALWENATYFDKDCYTSLKMSYNDIKDIYFKTSDYKKMLARRNVLSDDLKPENRRRG